jgi:hypothetical protein
MSAPLEKPRWPGGPKICPSENLPAFESSKALDSFQSANSPSCKVVKKWQCQACGHWHAYTVAASPAGDSSGSGRNSNRTTVEDWKKFFAAQTPAELLEEIAQ